MCYVYRCGGGVERGAAGLSKVSVSNNLRRRLGGRGRGAHQAGHGAVARAQLQRLRPHTVPTHRPRAAPRAEVTTHVTYTTILFNLSTEQIRGSNIAEFIEKSANGVLRERIANVKDTKENTTK